MSLRKKLLLSVSLLLVAAVGFVVLYLPYHVEASRNPVAPHEPCV